MLRFAKITVLALAVGAASADQQPKSVGQSCSQNNECASNTCMQGKCESLENSGGHSAGTGQKSPDGAICSQASDCITNVCTNTKCGSAGTGHSAGSDHSTGTGQKSPDGATCSQANDCITNVCTNTKCGSRSGSRRGNATALNEVEKAATGAFSNCFKNAATKEQKAVCAQTAREEIATALGRNASGFTDIEFEEAKRESAKGAVAAKFSECFKDSSVVDKSTCTSEARNTLASSLGSDNVTNLQVREYQMEGAKGQVGDKIKNCVDNAGSDSGAIAACANNAISSVKDTLASSLGKNLTDISDIEADRYIKDNAKDTLAAALAACVENNGGVSCAPTDQSVRDALQEVTGKTFTEIEIRKQMQDGAADAVSDAMAACAETGETNCALNAAKAAFKGATGSVTDPTDTELRKAINDGAKLSAGSTIRACREAATTSDEKSACSATSVDVKRTLASSLGKNLTDISDIEADRYIKDNAKDTLAAALAACVENNGGVSCAPTDQSVRDALQEVTGKTFTEIEIRKQMQDGAADAVSDAMAACAETGETNCALNAAKAAFKGATGSVTDPTDTELRKAINDGAKLSAGSTIRACREAATTSDEKSACSATSDDVINAISAATGKSSQEIKPQDGILFLKDFAVDEAADTLSSCMELAATASNPETAKGACLTGDDLKKAVRDATGEDDVSGAAVFAFVTKGAKRQATSSMEACIQTGSITCFDSPDLKNAVKQAYGDENMTTPRSASSSTMAPSTRLLDSLPLVSTRPDRTARAAPARRTSSRLSRARP